MRDEDGSLLDDDKAVWVQGRATWMLSTLYNTVEQRQEWLEGARLGYEFLNKHCFDSDGKMFFHVTREGNPIRKRRYFFSETFYVIAAAAYAKASGDQEAAEKARLIFGKCIEYATHPELLPAKFTDTRPSKGIGVPMILINTAQVLRETIGDPRCDEWISKWIAVIERDFVKDDIRCVMEQVAPDGSIIDHIDGRTLNPGHAIEGAWFILHEAIYRNRDQRLIDLGCRMIDYMWERGWDQQYGGILYFRDVYHKPVQEYEGKIKNTKKEYIFTKEKEKYTKFKTGITELEKIGFDQVFNSKYKNDTDENDGLIITDLSGKQIPDPKVAGRFLSFAEVLEMEGKAQNVWELNPHTAKNSQPQPTRTQPLVNVPEQGANGRKLAQPINAKV